MQLNMTVLSRRVALRLAMPGAVVTWLVTGFPDLCSRRQLRCRHVPATKRQSRYMQHASSILTVRGEHDE